VLGVHFGDVVGKGSFGEVGGFGCITMGTWKESNGLEIDDRFVR
jgi:hypothetical protein